MRKLFLLFILTLSFTNCTINNSDKSTTGSLVDSIVVSKDSTLEIKTHQGLYNTSTKSILLCDGKQMNVVDETKSIDTLIARKFPLGYSEQTIFVEVKAIAQPKDFVIKEIIKIEHKNFRNTCIPYDFWCLGTEPFWTIQISQKENLIDFYDPMEQKTYHFEYIKPTLEKNNIIYNTKNKSDNIGIQIKNEPCSDGMSERTYNHSVIINFNGNTFKGCAVKFGEPIQNN
jgi:uncharacterized membrane protein